MSSSSPSPGWNHLGPYISPADIQTRILPDSTSPSSPIIPSEIIARIFLHHNDLRQLAPQSYRVMPILTACKALKDEYLPLLYSTVVIESMSQFLGFMNSSPCSSWKWISTLKLRSLDSSDSIVFGRIRKCLKRRRLMLLEHADICCTSESFILELDSSISKHYKATAVPQLSTLICSSPKHLATVLATMLDLTQPRDFHYHSTDDLQKSFAEWPGGYCFLPQVDRVEWIGDLWWCPWSLASDFGNEDKVLTAFVLARQVDLILIDPDLTESGSSSNSSFGSTGLKRHMEGLDFFMEGESCFEKLRINAYLVGDDLMQELKQWARGKAKVELYCNRDRDFTNHLERWDVTHEELLTMPLPNLDLNSDDE